MDGDSPYQDVFQKIERDLEVIRGQMMRTDCALEQAEAGVASMTHRIEQTSREANASILQFREQTQRWNREIDQMNETLRREGWDIS